MLDPTRFRHVPILEAHYPTFRTEFDRLTRDDFMAMGGQYDGGYSGGWLIMPLFFGTFDSGLDHLFPANQAKCPETTRILQEMPGVITGSFSWLDPGSRIGPHTDLQPENVVRTHIGMRIPGGGEIRTQTEARAWEAGRCVVFDGLVEHEAENPADEPRVVLVVDRRIDGDELDYVRSKRG